MRKKKRAGDVVEGRVSRREFLGQSAATAMAFSIVPRDVAVLGTSVESVELLLVTPLR